MKIAVLRRVHWRPSHWLHSFAWQPRKWSWCWEISTNILWGTTFVSGSSDNCNFRQKLLQGKRIHGLYDARGPSVLKMKLLTLFNNHCQFRWPLTDKQLTVWLLSKLSRWINTLSPVAAICTKMFQAKTRTFCAKCVCMSRKILTTSSDWFL